MPGRVPRCSLNIIAIFVENMYRVVDDTEVGKRVYQLNRIAGRHIRARLVNINPVRYDDVLSVEACILVIADFDFLRRINRSILCRHDLLVKGRVLIRNVYMRIGSKDIGSIAYGHLHVFRSSGFFVDVRYFVFLDLELVIETVEVVVLTVVLGKIVLVDGEPIAAINRSSRRYLLSVSRPSVGVCVVAVAAKNLHVFM